MGPIIRQCFFFYFETTTNGFTDNGHILHPCPLIITYQCLKGDINKGASFDFVPVQNILDTIRVAEVRFGPVLQPFVENLEPNPFAGAEPGAEPGPNL
jgi:hypothetical protein